MFPVAVRGKTGRSVEPGLSAGDEVENTPGDEATQNLGGDVGKQLAARKTPRRPEADRHRGVEMSAGDVGHRVGHRENGEAERQRNAEKANADPGKRRGEDGTATPTEN